MSKDTKMTQKEALESSNELSAKLRKVVEDHFGQIPGISEFEESVGNMFVAANALSEVMVKLAFTFAMQTAEEKQSSLPLELENVFNLYEDLMAANVEDISEYLDDLDGSVSIDKSKLN